MNAQITSAILQDAEFNGYDMNMGYCLNDIPVIIGYSVVSGYYVNIKGETVTFDNAVNAIEYAQTQTLAKIQVKSTPAFVKTTRRLINPCEIVVQAENMFVENVTPFGTITSIVDIEVTKEEIKSIRNTSKKSRKTA